MKKSIKIILIVAIILGGCSGDAYRRIYETSKMRNEGFKSPEERAISPTPNYSEYKRERDALKTPTPTTEFDLHSHQNERAP